MNAKVAKKIRKQLRKNTIVAEREFMKTVRDASFRDRIVFALRVIFRVF